MCGVNPTDGAKDSDRGEVSARLVGSISTLNLGNVVDHSLPFYCSMGERQPSRLLICHKRKLPVGSNPTTTAKLKIIIRTSNLWRPGANNSLS